MFTRAINVFFFFLAALALFAGVSASPAADPQGYRRPRPPVYRPPTGGSTTTTTTTVNSQSCGTGPVTCCNSVQQASSTNFGDLFGPLSSLIGPISGNVGLTCSPVTVGGAGGVSCNAQTVCCQGNHFNGLIAVGCNPININA